MSMELPQPEDPEKPLISAIMLAGRQPAWQIQLAVNCFANQTWPNKELIIVNNALTQYQAAGLELVLPRDGKRTIATIVDTAREHTAGMCRNYGISAASGNILAQFDAHCWHSPHRLAEQFAALVKHQAHVCLLQEGLEYSYGSGYLARWSNPKRCILNSALMVRPRENDHQDVDKCEELTLLTGLLQSQYRPIALDRPGLICRMHYVPARSAVKRPVALPGVDGKLLKQMRPVIKAQALG